jgi:putative thioredoxin
MATLGLSAEDQQAVAQFRADVVEPSMTSLVILDFWAEWCGPCKQLTPVLEKVAADYAGKGVVLRKINVDDNKFIAAQFRIQSIPTVYAMFQGQPVADLTNARTESQLKGLLDQILRQLPVAGADAQAEQEVEPLLAMGEEVLAGGEAERAAGIFAQIVEIAPTSAPAHAGLVRSLVALGDFDQADAVLASLPEDVAKDAAIGQARSALALARNAPPPGEMARLAAAVAANPDDHQARLDLAGAQIAAGQRDAAADNLLASIAADRGWNDGAARTRLLELFEAVGLEDDWVKAQRRRLSDILFG